MIRKARIDEVKTIQELVNFYAKKELVLPRSLNMIYEDLRDFFVYEEKGHILGCIALHISWEDLAEIKSLAVAESEQGKDIGSGLVKAALAEAREFGVKKVFALSYCPDFFKKQGFREIEKAQLPHKIWGECINCPKFPDCQEVSLVIDI